MNYLLEIEINSNDLEEMIKINPMLEYLDIDDINNNILFLRKINCSNEQIKNIIITNPFYLNRSIEDLEKLVNKLISLKLPNLNLLFNSNPFLLNKDAFEIEKFIKEKLNEGMDIDDISDLIDFNPYIFETI